MVHAYLQTLSGCLGHERCWGEGVIAGCIPGSAQRTLHGQAGGGDCSWGTFAVYASLCSSRLLMSAAAELVVGLTENLFSSCTSSFSSSLSARSLSMAALGRV